MIRFNYGVTVICEACDYYDVYMIDADEYRIELSDNIGMVIGTIDISKLSECEIVNYDGDGNITSLSNLKEIWW